MTKLQRLLFVAAFLLARSLFSDAQANSPGSSSPEILAEVPSTVPVAPSPQASWTYGFPDRKQQFRNYLFSTFGPPALISTAVGAGLDQNKPAPPEWDTGIQGYGERYGWRFGMEIVGQTTEYSLGGLIHEDVTYHRCECAGFFPRSAHALSSILTARTPSGRTVFSLPALVSPYAGSFTAVNASYPGRYEPSDAFRIGNTSFIFKAAGNLIGEFLAPRR
jgi:hypothetical protein